MPGEEVGIFIDVRCAVYGSRVDDTLGKKSGGRTADEQAQRNVLSSIADILEYEPDRDEALYNVAQYLEDMHEETRHEAFNSVYSNSVFSDMLGFVLCYVNWKELAEMYIEQVKEDIL